MDVIPGTFIPWALYIFFLAGCICECSICMNYIVAARITPVVKEIVVYTRDVDGRRCWMPLGGDMYLQPSYCSFPDH
jgi:pyruvate-formate lyase-activating enzyme